MLLEKIINEQLLREIESAIKSKQISLPPFLFSHECLSYTEMEISYR